MPKPLPNTNPTSLPAWKALAQHKKSIESFQIKSFFKQEPNRLDYTTFSWEEFYVDTSKNRWDKKTFELLIQLCNESQLKVAIEAQFAGEKINVTEDRAVLHTALRKLDSSAVYVNSENIVPEVKIVQEKMFAFCEKIISGEWKG